MSEDKSTKRIDKMLDKLLKEAEADIPVEKETSFKARIEAAKLAISWEKVKHAINEKGEGGEFGTGDQ